MIVYLRSILSNFKEDYKANCFGNLFGNLYVGELLELKLLNVLPSNPKNFEIFPLIIFYKTHSNKNSGQKSLWCKDIPQTDRIGDKAIPEHEAIILNYILCTESIHIKFI